jgi:hypothetical protein
MKKEREVMSMIKTSNRTQGKRLLTLALLAAVVLAGAFVASGKKPVNPPPGAFLHLENGINHTSMPCDSHHICAVGMNSMLGHSITMITLTSANRGLIEYQSQTHVGDAVYGVVDFKTSSEPERTIMNIRFIKGTGRYAGVTGVASGTLQYIPGMMGVHPYSAKVSGTLILPAP